MSAWYRSLALAFCLGIAAQTAAALSCLPPTVERAFDTAHQAKETYVPVLGSFMGFAQRPEGETLNGLDRRFRAVFQGHFVTSRGLGGPVRAEVAMLELCLGPWCPAFAPDVPVLTFLHRDGTGYRFQVDACHSNYFADPTGAQIETLQNCLKTRACNKG